MSLSDANPLDLIKRLSRERKARREAEMIAERVTSELYSALNERERRSTASSGCSISRFGILSPLPHMI